MGRAERTNVVTPDEVTPGVVTPAMIEPREPGPLTDPAVELAALLERIAKAAALEPQPHDLHCRDCFHRGRNAALRLILGE
jgi:hypothetical protein